MELRHLRYFVAVAEELHFGRAAERLGIAQPPLSQQIKQLEAEVGVELFERTNRRVRLSAAGEAFLGEARGILARAEEAKELARRASRGEAGWLGIGFVPSATYELLPLLLTRFRAECPGVELVLHELTSAEQAEALRQRQIHVGFARVRWDDEELFIERVASDPVIAALPAAHPLAARAEVPAGDLARAPLVLFPPRRTGEANYVLRILAEFDIRPRTVQEAGELHTAVSLVAAGIGYALVPGSVRHLRRDGVVYRPLAAPAPTLEMLMAFRRDETSPALARFVALVRAATSEQESPADAQKMGIY